MFSIIQNNIGNPVIIKALILSNIHKIIMSYDLHHLSLEELHELAAKAQRALEDKRKESRRAVIAQIKELADSIGVSISITDGDRAVSARKGSKVAAKYRNPHNFDQTWTGRGVKPRWLAALVNEGRQIEEFLI